MSNFAITWAFEAQIENPTHKLVLVALADFADAAGESYPSVEMLAWRACTSPRTVRRALQSLEEAGLLKRVMGLTATGHGGHLRTNSVFRLSLPERVAQAPAQIRRPAVLRETPSQAREVMSDPTEAHRAVTHDLTVSPADECPSQAREVTGVLTDDREVTGDHAVRTLVTIPPTPPYKEEPSLPNPPNPPAPTAADGAWPGPGQVGRSGDLDDEGAVAADAADPAPTDEPVAESVDADWALMRDCLPEPMQTLDGPTVARVAGLLRERLEAGWTAELIHNTLAGNELPKEVHRLGGLVVTRLRAIPVEGAPRRKPAPPTPKPSGPAEPPEPRYWRAYQVAKKRAELLGLPEAQRPSFWWMTEIGSERSSIPQNLDLEAAVRDLVAAEIANGETPTNTLEHA